MCKWSSDGCPTNLRPVRAGSCEMFEGGGGGGEWAWTRGRYGDVTRTVVSGRAYVLDVVELASRGDHLIELPWHFRGTGDGGRGTWTSGELADEFVSRVERFVPASSGSVVLELAEGSRVLKVFLLFDGELLRAEGPGLPRGGTRTMFYLARARGRSARFVTVLEPVGEGSVVRAVRTQGGVIEVET